jgi:hypothetical protein
VRPGRSDRLGPGHRVAQVVERLAAHRLAHLREEVRLLLLDVVADVLHEHRDLRLEPLGPRIHALELRQHPLGHVVLLERLEDLVLRLRHRLAHRRVEDRLLDLGVHRELLDDVVDDAAALDESTVARLLEALEQPLDCAVVVFEERDCIHSAALCPMRAFGMRISRTTPRRAAGA